MPTANATQVQTGFLDLIANAGFVGKTVLLVLLLASVLSWALIFMKWKGIRCAVRENKDFLDAFWHGKNIEEIYAKTERYPRSPVAGVFKSGFKELKKLTSGGDAHGDAAVGNIQRALMRASHKEVGTLEKHVSWLATIASASPFIGLFGTVWGIMDSFQQIGATGAANLAVVAPGISEALVATAGGIGAAIPAVVAYNHFAAQIRRVAVDMDCFGQDFLNIVQRSFMSGAGKSKSAAGVYQGE